MTLNAAMEETLTKTTRLSTKLVVLHFHQKIRSMFIYLALNLELPHAGSGVVFLPKLYCGVFSVDTEEGEASSGEELVTFTQLGAKRKILSPTLS